MKRVDYFILLAMIVFLVAVAVTELVSDEHCMNANTLQTEVCE